MFIRRSPRNDINILCSESHGYSQICFSLFSPREDIYLLGLELKVSHLGWLRENFSKRERRERFIHLHCIITITPWGQFCKNKYKLSTYRNFHTKTNPYFDNLLPRWWVSLWEGVFYEGLYAARLWQPEWCVVMFHVNIKPFCRLTLAW